MSQVSGCCSYPRRAFPSGPSRIPCLAIPAEALDRERGMRWTGERSKDSQPPQPHPVRVLTFACGGARILLLLPQQEAVPMRLPAAAVWCVILALPSTAPAQHRVYFGNLHSHTSYSDGSGTPENAYRHARDVAGLDFLAITEHNHEWARPARPRTVRVFFRKLRPQP